MSITFGFKGDQELTEFWGCQCIHLTAPLLECPECKGTCIVDIKHDAHECNFTTSNAARILGYIGIKFPDGEYVVAFKPTIEQVRILSKVLGTDYHRCRALMQTIMAALHFKADEIVGA